MAKNKGARTSAHIGLGELHHPKHIGRSSGFSKFPAETNDDWKMLWVHYGCKFRRVGADDTMLPLSVSR